MKKIIISAFVGLSLATATFANNVPSRPVVDAQTAATQKTTTFTVGVFPVTTSDVPILNVIVDKIADSRLSIQVYSEQGMALSSESLPRKAGKYWTKLNFSHLPDGAYTVAITNGVETMAYSFVVNTSTPQAPARHIRMD